MTPRNREVDRRDELEAGGVHGSPFRAGDADDAVLERLPKRLERRAHELGQLIEKQHTAVPECAGMSLEVL